MTLSRLKTIVAGHSLLLCFILFPGQPLYCEGIITPDRNISIINGATQKMAWKQLWDRARQHARDKDFVKAMELYGQLFQEKPNVEDGTWEYCKILLQQRNFNEMGKVLERLLELNPGRLEYLLAAGQHALFVKDYERAVRYLGTVFGRDPAGDLGRQALEGLIDAFSARGRRETSFSLLEQLAVRKPDDNALLHRLARAALLLEKEQKAKWFYRKILDKGVFDDQILLEAAGLFEMDDDKHLAAELWERYLESHPSYIVFRKKLLQELLHWQRYGEGAEQLFFLFEEDGPNWQYLPELVDLYLNKLSRPDKALKLLEQYRTAFPGDLAVGLRISKIETVLANDFLAIVENDGSSMLWQDLAEVAPNRLSIYRQMADLLQQKGRRKELIDILEILHENQPKDTQLAMRLVHQYLSTGQTDNVLNVLDTFSASFRDKDYYILRETVESSLGLELQALSSLEKALSFEPEDLELREKCLTVYGSLGLVLQEQRLFHEGVTIAGEQLQAEFVFLHLQELADNRLYHEYQKVYIWARDRFYAHGKVIVDLQLLYARMLHRQGKSRKAEQLLRQLLNREYIREKALFALVEIAIEEGRLGDAANWLVAVKKLLDDEKDTGDYQQRQWQYLLYRIRHLSASGKYKRATVLAREELEAIRKKDGGKSRFLRVFTKELCLLYLQSEEFDRAAAVLSKLEPDQWFDPELQMISTRVSRHGGEIIKVEKKDAPFQQFSSRPSALILAVEKALENHETEAAASQLATLISQLPDSVLVKRLQAEYFLVTWQLSKSLALFEELIQQFPEESYFYRQKIKVEMRRGHYGTALATLASSIGLSSVDLVEMMAIFTDSDDKESVLFLARLLWGDSQYRRALSVYQHLLAPEIRETLVDRFRASGLDYLYLVREKSFWGSVKAMLQSEPELVEILMGPEFLLNYTGSAIGEIVSGQYELYATQKLIRSEYQARKAIYDKNYSYAASNFERLWVEEHSTEGMMDLASIYARMGAYRKEAQIYEAISDQSENVVPDDLQQRKMRNKLQLSPTSGIHFSTEEREGRNGAIDFGKASIGTDFKFTPELNKELTVGYSYLQYGSVSGDTEEYSHSLSGSVFYEFFQHHEIVFDGAMEKFDDESGSDVQYGLSYKTKLDDYVGVLVKIEQRPVADTLSSLLEGHKYDGLETGISFDTPYAVQLGGEIRFLNYNNGNNQTRFHAYTRYRLFKDSLQFDLKYDCNYFESRLEDDFQADGQYWLPDFFREHRFSATMQHSFSGNRGGALESISYYQVEVGLSLEEEDVVANFGGVDIFLEMSPDILLKGNVSISSSDVFEEKSLGLSLFYRW